MRIAVVDGRWHATYGGASRMLPLERAGNSLVAAAAPPSPCVLVGATMGLAPFVDHAGVLADFVSWLGADDPVSARSLTGPAGVGKSRTAQCLCQEAERRGWLAGLLAFDADRRAMTEMTATPTALLVVLEDAETRGGQLAALVPLLVEHARTGYPARLVLTIRDGTVLGRWRDTLAAAGDELAGCLGPAVAYDLAGCPAGPGARRRLYSGAYRAFATQLSLPPTGEDDSAGWDDVAAFSNPLLIVMSAYLHVLGDRVPPSERELLDRFLDDHEDRYWTWLVDHHGLPLLRDRSLRRQVAALATLAGASDETEAINLLSLLDDSRWSEKQRRDMARWAARLHPGPQYWNPLQPGLVAEHLVAEQLVAGGWGDDAAVVHRLFSRAQRGALNHPVGLLARAAVDRPDLVVAIRPVLDRRLGYLCDQAVADSALATALTNLVEVCPPDPAGVPAVLDGLPAQSELGVRSLASMLNEQVATHFRCLAQHDPAGQGANLAVALNNLSVRLADVGRSDEASAAIAEAVVHYRRLAGSDASTHRPHLAVSLYNLSLRLADIGQRDEATTASREAVTHLRALSEQDPQTYRPKLAAALNDLSQRLAATGWGDEAATATGEAIAHLRALSDDEPQTYRPKLAAALNDLSQRLVATGRKEKGRAAAVEAVAHYRDLAAANPAFVPYLAASLQGLAARLRDLGLSRESSDRQKEAQAILEDGRRARQPKSTARDSGRVY